jgi:hypothetical protein
LQEEQIIPGEASMPHSTMQRPLFLLSSSQTWLRVTE